MYCTYSSCVSIVNMVLLFTDSSWVQEITTMACALHVQISITADSLSLFNSLSFNFRPVRRLTMNFKKLL